jgi:putative PEP-CTERM system TPR-repeat lipoprotein
MQRGDVAGAIRALEPARNSSDPQALAMLGVAYLRSGYASEATQALERAVTLAPDMASFRNQLALSLISQGEGDEAQTVLESAVKIDGDQFHSDTLLAILRTREGNYDGAAEAVERLMDKQGDNPLGLNLLGMVEMGRGDDAAAKAAFEDALKLDPSYIPAVRNLTELAERSGDHASVEAEWRRLLKASPGNEEAYLALAGIAIEQSRTDDALEFAQAAVSANPGRTRPRLMLARVLAVKDDLDAAGDVIQRGLDIDQDNVALLIQRGRIAAAEGETAKVREVVETLERELDESTPPAVWHSLAELQLAAGDGTGARLTFERVLQSEPEHTAALAAMVRIHLATEEVASARHRLDQLKVIDEHAPMVTALEADVLYREGRADEAIELYSELAAQGSRQALIRLAAMQGGSGDHDSAQHTLNGWLETHPEDVGVKLVLANLLLQTGQGGEAESLYEPLLYTGNPIVLNNLAWLYFEKGDGRAAELAQRAYDAAPNHSGIVDTLGWILVQTGREDDGVTLLRKSVDISSDNPTTQYHLGVALLRTGNAAQAERWLERALSFGEFPEAAEARHALNQIADS